ncbi:MAG TPA: DUF1003 domain-containing protein [Ktedonobacterales bacterium]|jgi:uncharacterized membrane protein|nr:DUF1003 domain-containing protein [Ktedonobacterales bacterium]
MLKSVAPIWGRLRHLHRPELFKVHGKSGVETDQPTVGQQLAEKVAAGVGSWTFLSIQASFLVLWLIYNALQFTRHFDSPPYILLNLLLSFQAAFTGPVLLIAANVGAMRDHKQSDRIEQLSKQNEDLGERLLAVEQVLEEHVTRNLATHAMELAELGVLMREVHGVVCAAKPATDGASEAEPPARTARKRSQSLGQSAANKAAPQGG